MTGPAGSPIDRTVVALALQFDESGLAARFPYVVTNREQLKAFSFVLHDLDQRLVWAAIRRLAVEEDTMPTPQRIRREAAAVAGMLTPGWGDAWAQAVRLARWEDRYHHGERGEPRPPVDLEVPRLVGLLGGYAEVIGPNQATVRAQFRDLWRERKTDRDRVVLQHGGELARFDASALPAAGPAAVAALPRAAR